MCDECYAPYQPWAEVTPAMREAVGWLRVLYGQNAAGGNLHVWVDDMNLPAPKAWPDWMNHAEISGLDDKCLEMLNRLTEHEQATALAIVHGYYVHEAGQDEFTDEMWEAQREFLHIPRNWKGSGTQVPHRMGKWALTWLEPNEPLPVLPDWVSVEGWHRSAAEADR